MFIIIAAISQNYVIGRQGRLPWHISSDLKRFNKITSGNTVVMGRKTFNNIKTQAEKFGRKTLHLPNRKNVVCTHQNDIDYQEVEIVNDIDSIWELKGKVYIIGGESLYRQTFDKVDYLEITYIKNEIEGDAFFPEIKPLEWSLTGVQRPAEDCKFDYEFRSYARK
jgi:dihydrofolate reductase